MLFTLALVLALRPPQEPRSWTPVPAFVVPELRGAGTTWKEDDGWPDVRPLRVGARREGRALRVAVGDADGLLGGTVALRITSTDGAAGVEACCSWLTDAGPEAGSLADLHGVVRVEERVRGERGPLRLAFLLQGVRLWGSGRAEAARVRGEILLPLDPGTWDEPLCSPGMPAADAPLDLRVVEVRDERGALRARGAVDAFGRRHGAWTAWHVSGALMSECGFRAGLRHGPWVAADDEGRPSAFGWFEAGLPSGAWTECFFHGGGIKTQSGLFLSGRKEGEWVVRDVDGSVVESGPYVAGVRHGPWTRWYRDGSRSRGAYRYGHRDGAWTHWSPDGTRGAVEVVRRPPWAPESSF